MLAGPASAGTLQGSAVLALRLSAPLSGESACAALAADAPAARPQVCTLADLDYDVFHATVDNRSGIAEQEFFVRPRFGEGADRAAPCRQDRVSG